MTTRQAQSRYLWGAFLALFSIVALASMAPVEPTVGVVPLWAAVVFGAMLASVAVGLGAVAAGWPAERGGEQA